MATRYDQKTKDKVVAYIQKYDKDNMRGGQSAAVKKWNLNPSTVKSWLDKARMETSNKGEMDNSLSPPSNPTQRLSQGSPATSEFMVTREVSFGKAKYQAICPECKEIYTVSGKYISSEDSIKCPNKVCGWRMSIKELSFKPFDDELVVYNRIKNFFSYEGRISVKDFWFSVLIASPVILIAIMVAWPLYPLFLFVMLHSLCIKRYHDHGMQSAWITVQVISPIAGILMNIILPKIIFGGKSDSLLLLIIIVFVQLLALITGIIISLVPGKKRLNRYGPNTSNVKKLWI